MEIATSKNVEQIKKFQNAIIKWAGAEIMSLNEILEFPARDVTYTLRAPRLYKAFGISMDENGIVNGLLYKLSPAPWDVVKITKFCSNLLWVLKDYYED